MTVLTYTAPQSLPLTLVLSLSVYIFVVLIWESYATPYTLKEIVFIT